MKFKGTSIQHLAQPYCREHRNENFTFFIASTSVFLFNTYKKILSRFRFFKNLEIVKSQRNLKSNDLITVTTLVGGENLIIWVNSFGATVLCT